MMESAGKERLEREECLRQDMERAQRDLEGCYTHPGCDYAETCVDIAKARAEDRVEACVSGASRTG